MDFADIGLLSETLVEYTMYSEERLAPIATALNLSGGPNDSMVALSSLVVSPNLSASTYT
jgi:hypothetical protein